MKNIFLSFIFVVLISACGSLNIYTKPGHSFSKNTTFSIMSLEDRSGTVGELTHLLLSEGFNIVSYSTAKSAIKYKGKISRSENNSEIDAEIYRIKELNSIYVLELDYTYYYDVFYYAYKSFSAKMIDLNSGEIVISASFRGDRSVSSVLSELVEKMKSMIK